MTLLRIGLALSVLLTLAGLASSLNIQPDANGRLGALPLAIFATSVACAAATLALLVPAWRGGRKAASVVAAAQLAQILTSLPVFFASPDAVPMAGLALAAAGAVLEVTAFFLILLGFAQRLGRADALAHSLRDAHAQVVAAREQERVAVHHELHDRVGTVLTSAIFRADAAGRLLREDPAGAAVQLEHSRGELRTALAELRRVVRGLRPAGLEQYGLWAALRQRAHDAARLSVLIELPPRPPVLPPEIELAVYRITAEALTNAERHSTGTRVRVTIEAGDALRLAVVDDGAVSAPWRPGVGIASMREQAEELGGTAHAGPSAEGWRVDVTIPLR